MWPFPWGIPWQTNSYNSLMSLSPRDPLPQSLTDSLLESSRVALRVNTRAAREVASLLSQFKDVTPM